MGNPVVHFELGAVDYEPLVTFYEELFGWRTRTTPGSDYALVDTQGGGGINGGIGKSRTGEPWAPVDWFEVLGADATRTQAFYTQLFGWKVGEGAPGYGLVDTEAGRGIQGGLGAGEAARWATVYASVPDVETTLTRAEELGGTRVYGPVAADDHTQTGAFRDPAGNVFGVYHHGSH